MKQTIYHRARSALIAFAMLGLVGCNLEVRVPQGGKVVSEDGSFVCEEGQTCVISVVDIFFDQTFIAVPDEKAGYSFSEWRDKEGYACAGETGPCALSTAQFEGSAEMQAFLESDETVHLEPRFIWAPCPPEDDELVVSPAPGGH